MRLFLTLRFLTLVFLSGAANDGESIASTLNKILGRLDNKEAQCDDKYNILFNQLKQEMEKITEDNKKLTQTVENMEGTVDELKISLASLNQTFNSVESKDPDEDNADPCSPTPCGPGSLCISVGDAAVCSCGAWYLGEGQQMCEYECRNSSSCISSQTCVHNMCKDCSDICGEGAMCKTNNHVPVCACKPGEKGDPMLKCGCASGFMKLGQHCYSSLIILNSKQLHPLIVKLVILHCCTSSHRRRTP